MNNKALNPNASNQLNQPLTALAKTKTFMWVQSKVSRQIKHVHLWKLDKVVTIRKLITTAQSEITSEFEFIQKRCKISIFKEIQNFRLIGSLKTFNCQKGDGLCNVYLFT